MSIKRWIVRGGGVMRGSFVKPLLGRHVPLPTQSGSISYEDPVPTNLGDASMYGRPGGLVVAGRTAYAQQAFKDVSAAGGTVLIYIDPIIDASYGRYHQLLMTSSEYGAAIPSWPGPVSANQYGNLLDFRPTSVMHQPSATNSNWTKLEAILELMVTENPHMGGFFCDDLGSRSYFPNIDWNAFGDANRQAYRAGAILVAKTFDRVCKRHGIVFAANGTWSPGTLEAAGGGYPDMNQMGLSLCTIFTVENHPWIAGGYTDTWVSATQWGSESMTGKGYALVLVNNETDRQNWVNGGKAAWVCYHPSGYSTVSPWGGGRNNGLPSKVEV